MNEARRGNVSDLLIRRERRGIWLALAVIGVLGAGACVQLAGYDGRATHYMTLAGVLIPLGILLTATCASLRRKRPLDAHRRAVRNDEGRKAAMDRACRYSLAATLGTMSIYAILSQAWPTTLLPSALIALFVVLGVVTFLGSFLWLDRG